MNTLSRAAAPALLTAGALVAAALGCDARPSVESSTAEATVKGTVYVKGKAGSKNKVTVVFDPANYMRKDVQPRKVDMNPDGTYEIKTLVGPNEVRVEGKEVEKAGGMYDRYPYDVPAAGGTFDIRVPK